MKNKLLASFLCISFTAFSQEAKLHSLNFAEYTLRIDGTARGGTIVLGRPGIGQNITIETIKDESAEKIVEKLVVAYNARHKSNTAKGQGNNIQFFNTVIGDIFLRVNDDGIKSASNVQNIKAVYDTKKGTVKFTWTVPQPLPDRIAIIRPDFSQATLTGNLNSYDEKIDISWIKDGKLKYIILAYFNDDTLPSDFDIVNVEVK